LDLIDPNLSRMSSGAPGSHEEPSKIWREETGTGSLYSGNLCDFPVMVRILLLKDRDRALSSDRVNTLAGQIIEHVVTVPNRGNSLDNLSCEGIQHDQASGSSANDKQPVIRFV